MLRFTNYFSIWYSIYQRSVKTRKKDTLWNIPTIYTSNLHNNQNKSHFVNCLIHQSTCYVTFVHIHVMYCYKKNLPTSCHMLVTSINNYIFNRLIWNKVKTTPVHMFLWIYKMIENGFYFRSIRSFFCFHCWTFRFYKLIVCCSYQTFKNYKKLVK
jgi:hypothetical protein